MRIHRWAVIAAMTILTVCSILMMAGHARADEPSQIDKEAARTSLEQGDERMKVEDWEGALEAYRRADDIMGVPTTSIEVGRAALKLGRLVLAYSAFRRAAKYPKKSGEPTPFTAARKEAKKLAKEIKPRIPRLTLEVDGVDPDVEVEVLIDEEPIDAWARPMGIDPGMHAITARATGYEPASRDIVMQEGEKRTVTLELVPLGDMNPDQPISPGDTEDDTWWTVAVVGLTVGGASLIAGAITGGLSLSDASAVKDQCVDNRCPPEAEDQLNRSQTLAHVSTTTLIVGGVAAALGITAIVIASSGDGDDEEGDREDREEEASLRISPLGASLRVRF